MIIQCERCRRKFRIDDSRIQPPGNRVRCSKCGNVFFVEKKQEPPPEFKPEPSLGLDNIDGNEQREEEPSFDWNSLDIERFRLSDTAFVERSNEGTQQEDDNLETQPLQVSPERLELDFEGRGKSQDSIDIPIDRVEEGDGEIQRVERVKLKQRAPDLLWDRGELSVKIEPQTDIKRKTTRGYVKRSKESRILSRLAFILVLFVSLVSAVYVLFGFNVFPREKINTYISMLPIAEYFLGSRNEVRVTDQSGRWISTRNGFMYVVSGHVVNNSNKVINYIKLQSRFKSGEDLLFEQVFYAGNTFTQDELKTLPLEDILLRLNRRNGDIDYRNPGKLAGLNYAVEPGESVPFFSVFPSRTKVLGLKHEIKVLGFEVAGY
ncbi:MAG: hypothetical protein KatS3mg078_1588 [Deltaproteobacteria bacterium]|nr:MAG: hypothetical protein KatS3mg078_1588 [Deltaproteobacteria bacterium]